MGTFSIWHWLIVLLVLLMVIAVPIIIVALSHGRLTRKDFIVRFAISFIAQVALMMFADEESPHLYLPAIILNFFLLRWIAMRLNAMQSSRWWALLWQFLPPIGLVMAIALSIKRAPIDTESLGDDREPQLKPVEISAPPNGGETT